MILNSGGHIHNSVVNLPEKQRSQCVFLTAHCGNTLMKTRIQIVQVKKLQRLQIETQVELPLRDATRDALLPSTCGDAPQSVLDRAFKGEL